MEAHDWTECPFAHPGKLALLITMLLKSISSYKQGNIFFATGEKARRRSPKDYLYTGVACPDFRKVRMACMHCVLCISSFYGCCEFLANHCSCLG
jgi:hypothetical protein